jgi:MFS transporter, DHA1 family, multidrug resistance protein
MYILVPVLPLAAADFALSRSAIQLAVTLYLFGIAGGQLPYGPVSDRFGRRPTLLAALCLYNRVSPAAGWAAGIATLVAAQVVQAVAGCRGLVLRRAIVRENDTTGEAASRKALLTVVQSLAPGMARRWAGFSARGSAGARSLSH